MRTGSSEAPHAFAHPARQPSQRFDMRIDPASLAVAQRQKNAAMVRLLTAAGAPASVPESTPAATARVLTLDSRLRVESDTESWQFG